MPRKLASMALSASPFINNVIIYLMFIYAVHGASGYLIQQFCDTSSNQRTDSYGGSVENRARFGLEALAAALEVFGLGRVSIKLSPAGGNNDVG